MIEFKAVRWEATKKPFFFTIEWHEATPKPEARAAGFFFTIRLLNTHFSSIYRSGKPFETPEEAMQAAEAYANGESSELDGAR